MNACRGAFRETKYSLIRHSPNSKRHINRDRQNRLYSHDGSQPITAAVPQGTCTVAFWSNSDKIKASFTVKTIQLKLEVKNKFLTRARVV